MTEAEIRALLAAGRKSDVDWLPGRAPIEDIIPILVAMGNSNGGTLVVGIAPRTNLLAGVDDLDGATDRILQAALSIIPPMIIPLPQTVEVGGIKVLLAQVPKGLPHVYSHEGRFLIRQDAQNHAMDAQTLRRLLMSRGEVSFEEETPPGATLDDLDWSQAAAFAASLRQLSGLSAQEVLLKRGCLAKHGEMPPRPTNAGILLFGKDPQRFVRGSEITAARFAGTEMGDVFTRQDITGTLPEQLRRAQTFLVDNLRKRVQIGQSMARDEQFEYPMEAARELVVNAVAHRDYSIQGDGVRLYIFADHMEVTSPGLLPGPVTLDNIAEERFSRNPIIVQVLSDMGFIERLGYGINRVITLMREHDLPPPEFKETGGGVQVVLGNTPTTLPEEEDDDTGFGGIFRGHEVNPRQELALDFLINRAHARITNKDLQELCPDVHAETIRRDLADLVNKGILIKMGQKRGSYYVLKK